jgi:hypothetical protein
VNVDNLSIFYVFCCLHKIRFFTDINKYYYIIYVLLSCDSSNDFNQNYTGRQNQVLKEKIQLLKSSIIEEIALDDDQFKIINQKLDDLSKKVDKLNKFDFRTAFFGILTNIASSVLYQNAPTFWGIVKKIFGSAVLGDGQNDFLI